mmetsp:Transcript_63496/g.127528  ORF Transcript_63496/g.127528 Transcript_63496/m.127528 type:complete len:153 (-) Transcript_63496:351-809(-)
MAERLTTRTRMARTTYGKDASSGDGTRAIRNRSLSTDQSCNTTSISTVEALESPSTHAAELAKSTTRRPREFFEEGYSGITNTATSFKSKCHKAITLGTAARFPLAVFGLGCLVSCIPLLGSSLGMVGGITGANVAHYVGKAARAEDNNIRA